MEMIEPNVAALAWFALFSMVASLGFYVVAGIFPLETRADLAGRPLRIALALAAAAAFAGLSVATGLYGYENLRWTSLVIVGGFALLFAPALYNAWPSRWRDGPAGLALTLAGCLAAACALRTIA